LARCQEHGCAEWNGFNPLNSTDPWLFTAELLEDVVASEGLTD